MNKLMTLMKDESGATLIEYALLAALIAVACIVAMQGLASKIGTQFNTIGTDVGR